MTWVRPLLIRRRGFTLIELLVVIVILGVLMAVAVPTFLAQQNKAQDSRTEQYLTTAFKAIRAGLPSNNQFYPASTSMVSWITQSEPELTAASGSCTSSVQSAPQDKVLVDPSSTPTSLTLCARSQSGNVWKLTASNTGVQSLLNGTLIPFTFSGNEITDITRAANVQGDGLTSDSSTGIWEATTNLVPNGGFETNTTGWTAYGGPGPVRDTSKSKFGAASGKMAAEPNGDGAYAEAPASQTTEYTASVWVYSTSGGNYKLSFQAMSSAHTFIAANDVTKSLPSNSWTRITNTYTSTPGGTNYLDAIVVNETGASDTYWIDGMQIEQIPYATPYVETSGAAATRNASLVQTSSSVLSTTQGWVAARVRMGVANTALASLQAPTVFSWYKDSDNRIELNYLAPGSGAKWQMICSLGGVTTSAYAPATFNVGDLETVVGSWGPSGCSLSLNGAAFITTAGALPNLTSTSAIEIGNGLGGTTREIDGDLLWFACGTGTLSNTDAAAINSWGSTDPSVSSFPGTAQATMAWNGDSSTGSLK